MSATPGRELALRILGEVEKGAYADVAFARLSRQEKDPRERAFAQDLAYGVVRYLLPIDHGLARYLRHPLEKLPAPIRNALRMGAYELMFGGGASYAAVSQAVELARAHGHAGTASLVNAVLRRVAEEPRPRVRREGLSLVYSFPEWLVERWVQRLGSEETEALCAALNRIPPLSGRGNLTRVAAEGLLSRLEEEGVRTRPGRYRGECFVVEESPVPVAELPAFREGLFSLQDEGSALVAPVLDPRPGERVVDACSAPGTKTAHLLELMGGRGEVLAVDINPRRLRLVEEGCSRLRLGGLRPVAGDARRLGDLLPDAWGGEADRILVDAPCSGLGALARRPDLRWRRRQADLETLARLQGEILDGVASALAPGGTLVYSTCTTEPEENQQVVDSFLDRHPDFVADDPAPWLPENLRGESRKGWLQLWPHRHATDGFFICRLRKHRKG
ncbi:MAG: 16S rRNA (cytosine(967)-C(5))-methyltransferase RsmB [Bacillota bacterium]